VRSLVGKCNALAERLAAVEGELAETKSRAGLRAPQQAEVAAATSSSTREGYPDHKTNTVPAEGVMEPGVVAAGVVGDTEGAPARAGKQTSGKKTDLTGKTKLDHHMEGVKDKLGQLHDVFHASANEERVRDEAGRTLQRVVRKAIMRRRYRTFKMAIVDWRRAHSKELLQVCARELERQQKITQKVLQLKLMREMKCMQWIFAAWEKDMRGNQQLRHHIKEAVNLMEGAQNTRWQRVVLRAWRGVVVGPLSRRSCRERRAARLAAARQALMNRLGGDGSGIVTTGMVREEMTRRLHSEMVERRRFHCLRQHLAALAGMASERREKEARAVTHHSFGVLSGIFYPWTEWTYAHSRGLDRKQWKGPRRFEVAYNRKRVAAFTRKVLLRKVVPAWGGVARRHAAARRMERRSHSRVASRNLRAWREVSVRHLALLGGAVDRWQGKGRELFELPFRAWFLFMDKRRKEKADNDRLILQHTRLKTRQLLWKIMRTWRHQAVFGRVEGLYSRTELMRSLAEQKTHCKGLEVQAREFTAAMQESHRLLEEEHAMVRNLETMLEGREEEVEGLQMALHHGEQELVRLRGVIDAVAQLHPAVTKHLVELQPKFGFADRNLSELTMARAKNDVVDALEEARALGVAWLGENEDAYFAAREKEAEEGSDALDEVEKELVWLGDLHEEAIRKSDEADAASVEREASAATTTTTTAAAAAAAATAKVTSIGDTGRGVGSLTATQDNTPTASPPSRAAELPTMSTLPSTPQHRPTTPSSPHGCLASPLGSVEGGARRISTRRMSRLHGGPAGPILVDKTQPPPMKEEERDALSRLQFVLKHCNFRDITEINGEELYREYDGFERPKTEEELQAVAAAAAAAKEREKQNAKLEELIPDDKKTLTTATLAVATGTTTTAAATEVELSVPPTKLPPEATPPSPLDAEANRKNEAAAMAVAVAKHMENNELLRQDLVVVHGIVEFLRSGNTNTLPVKQQLLWARENPAAGDSALSMASIAGRNWGGLATATSMVKDGSRTWNDFLLQVIQHLIARVLLLLPNLKMLLALFLLDPPGELQATESTKDSHNAR
jgi:hypothetical protein